jgi:hypothetical protein
MRTINYFKKYIGPIAFFLLIVLSLMSCVKQQTVSALDFQKNLLAGTGAYQNTKHTWKIDSLTVNGTAYKLTTVQKRYSKTFSRDGSYTDSDGVIGTWTMPTITDLVLSFQAGMSGIKIINKFQVVDINAVQLHLKYDSANVKQDIIFILNN